VLFVTADEAIGIGSLAPVHFVCFCHVGDIANPNRKSQERITHPVGAYSSISVSVCCKDRCGKSKKATTMTTSKTIAALLGPALIASGASILINLKRVAGLGRPSFS
jgi:hypothetical protein